MEFLIPGFPGTQGTFVIIEQIRAYFLIFSPSHLLIFSPSFVIEPVTKFSQRLDVA